MRFHEHEAASRRANHCITKLALGLCALFACADTPKSEVSEALEIEDPRERLKDLPPPPPLVPPSQAVRLAGHAAVGALGNFSYTIPLPLPPGRRLAPELALSYNSHGGDGPLGAGWSLNVGVSAVRFCSRTPARDGDRRGVRADGLDRLCLDDQRLIAVQGSYGGHLTEYRTENDTFARVISLVSAGQIEGFEVWTKGGLIKRYGKRPGCQDGTGQPCDGIRLRAVDRPTAWFLYQVEDRFGNTIEFEYSQFFNDRTDEAGPYDQTEELLPLRIRYTGHPASGLQPSREVLLTYEGRIDPAYGYYVGGRSSSERRLKQIDVMVNGLPQTRFELAYEVGAVSGRTRLIELRHCADTVCGQPTTFVYQDGPDAFDGEEIVSTGTPPAPLGVENQPLIADRDGDGRPDLVYEREGLLRILPSASGSEPFGPEITTTISSEVAQAIGVADFNVDGKAISSLRRHQRRRVSAGGCSFLSATISTPTTRASWTSRGTREHSTSTVMDDLIWWHVPRGNGRCS